MESLRVLTQLSADIDSDDLPEIMTVQSKPEDINESLTSEQTGKYSSVDTDQDLHIETIKRLQSLNDSMVKEKEEAIEEYEQEIKDLHQLNSDLEQENSDLKSELKTLQLKLEEIPSFSLKIQELSEKNRDLEKNLNQKTEIIYQLQETNKLLSNNSGNESLIQKIFELDSKLLESLKEIEELKNQLICVNVMYAEAETQKEMIIKRFIDQNRSNRYSWEFWKFWKDEQDN
jgi:predicted RNase H-like nuclease (RuvC/YqgF family)